LHLAGSLRKLSFFKMRFFSAFVLLLGIASSLSATAATEAAPRVFMAGDSTMADKPLDLPERGWGQLLPKFFSDAVVINNHAVNGRSTKSFIDEGRWQKLIDQVRAGDFVTIQFSHNDEKSEDPKRYTDPATTFRENLRRFVRETRAKQGSPILATPVCRRKFDADGKLVDTHGAYPDAVRAVASEEKVPLLELQQATAALLLQHGPEESKKFFMWFSPGEHPKLPQGVKDDTHFVELGATKVAELAVAQMRELKLPLTRWLK
jgi:DNA sulfur modification protein DndE